MAFSTTVEDPAYKLRKEAFVSNLSGGSVGEINLVTLVAPTGVFLWSALQSSQSFFISAPASVALLVDFFLNVGALLFAFTLYAQAPLLLNGLLTAPAAFLLLPIVSSNYSSNRGGRSKSAKDATANGHVSSSTSKGPTTDSQRPFLTHYRGYMMVSTCIAILAVDFPVFPRRFAKTENWGTSLMDLGVGSFVFSAGMVSARSLSKDLSDRGTSLLQRLVVSIRKTLPLIALGLIRLWSVKGLDYAEHVTEYGVHWNFFFTLAMLPPFVEIADVLTGLMPLPRIMTYDILYLIICLTYEMVLATTELKSYILTSPRGPDWLSKNREGVFSFIGYLAIFLSGRGIGASLFSQNIPRAKPTKPLSSGGNRGRNTQSQPRKPPTIQVQLAIKFILSFVTCVVLTDVHGFGLRPSRRLANSPYVAWVSAFNIGQIGLFYLVERVAFGQKKDTGATTPKRNSGKSESSLLSDRDRTSTILYAFNRHGLLVFLIANLLTGVVNLTTPTLDVSDTTAMMLLISYAAIVSGVALGLDFVETRYGWRLKL